MNRDRQCCDGDCLQGRDCPLSAGQRDACRVIPIRFAPGVIDGPHLVRDRRARSVAAACRRLAAEIMRFIERGCA